MNRLYGECNFTNFVVGAKIRFTGPNNPLGVGIIPFYRWYPDKADDFSGFNQMQRGASPVATSVTSVWSVSLMAVSSKHVNRVSQRRLHPEQQSEGAADDVRVVGSAG